MDSSSANSESGSSRRPDDSSADVREDELTESDNDRDHLAPDPPLDPHRKRMRAFTTNPHADQEFVTALELHRPFLQSYGKKEPAWRSVIDYMKQRDVLRAEREQRNWYPEICSVTVKRRWSTLRKKWEQHLAFCEKGSGVSPLDNRLLERIGQLYDEEEAAKSGANIERTRLKEKRQLNQIQGDFLADESLRVHRRRRLISPEEEEAPEDTLESHTPSDPSSSVSSAMTSSATASTGIRPADANHISPTHRSSATTTSPPQLEDHASTGDKLATSITMFMQNTSKMYHDALERAAESESNLLHAINDSQARNQESREQFERRQLEVLETIAQSHSTMVGLFKTLSDKQKHV